MRLHARDLADAVGNTNHEFLQRGADAVDVFCNKLTEIRDGIQRTQENNENRETDENQEDFKNTTRCFMCGDRSQKVLKD